MLPLLGIHPQFQGKHHGEQLLEAVRAAEASACDDLLYYCYGWADQALFDAIGEYEQHKGTEK